MTPQPPSDDRMLVMREWEVALLGVAEYWQKDGSRYTVAVYDAARIVEELVTRDGLSEDEAREYVSFNIEGAYVGPRTPILVWPTSAEELDLIYGEE